MAEWVERIQTSNDKGQQTRAEGPPVFGSIFSQIFLETKLLSWYKIVLEKCKGFRLLTLWNYSLPVEELRVVHFS